MQRIKFEVMRNPLWSGAGLEIHIYQPANDSRHGCVARPVQFEPLDEGMMRPAPALPLTEDEAQQLCDALWEAGVRPTNGAGSVGQLAATQEHLATVKAIAFHALKIPTTGNQ